MNKNDEPRPQLRVLVLLAGVRGACSGLVGAVFGWLIDHFTDLH